MSCRVRRAGCALDELIALTRVRQAGAGRTFSIKYATRYERAALERILAHYQATLLQHVYDGRTVTEWSRSVEDYGDLSETTPHLCADAARVAAIVTTRLKMDLQREQHAAERRELHALRKRLIDLARRLMDLPGYPALAGRTKLPDSVAQLAAEWVTQSNEETNSSTARPADDSDAVRRGSSDFSGAE